MLQVCFADGLAALQETPGREGGFMRSILIASALALAVVFLPSPAPALVDSAQAGTNDGTVTMTTWVYFNQGTCANGQTRYQVTLVATSFHRTITNRKVPYSNVLAGEAGHKCDSTYFTVQTPGSWNPAFGCGGR